MNARLLVSIVLAVMTSIGCDPVHQRDIDALGGEAPGVGTGPLHRPGQPCLTCHGGSGPGSPTFTVAGTIFQRRDTRDPAVGANVTLTDAAGRTFVASTNQAGNFYITGSEFDPVYPMSVKLCTAPGCDPLASPATAVAMRTHIGRDGSCGSCHKDPEGLDASGHVYLVDPKVTP